MYRAAVIGCGGIGSQLQFDPGATKYGVCTHAAAYDAYKDTELVSLCDTNDNNLNTSMQYWNVKNGYSDWNDLLIESKPDIVSICTPTSTHFDIAVACIDSGFVKGILLEKPVAENTEQAKKILKALKKSNVKVLVNYRRRFLKPIKSLKQTIDKLKLGKPLLIRGLYTKGIVHNGSHWVDLLRYLFGDPAWLEAEDRLQDGNNDPGLDVVFGFDSGLRAHLSAFSSNCYTIFEMDIFLSNGRIRITEGSESIYVYEVIDNYPFNGYRALNPKGSKSKYMFNWMSEVLDDLIYSVNNNVDPICTINDGIENQRITSIAKSSMNDKLQKEGCINKVIL
jgi:predicted dehydrogenase